MGLAAAVVLFFVVSAFCFLILHRSAGLKPEAEIVIGDSFPMAVEIARTGEERYKGLSGLDEIKFDQGKLFIHQSKAKHPYVMRGMLFDLDFVFIDGSEVADIQEGVSKDYEGQISGEVEYDKVLELRKGTVESAGIEKGEKVDLLKAL